ncbi:MAG: diaminopropionate ammonia-lyase [Actinomycetota bacterium]|nr:diaminopropionate ammonia-lyase [Actinomycetota bacterium]
MAVHPNPMHRHGLVVPPASDDVRRFHERIDGYAPTPLRRLDPFAERLGVAEVWVKDEAWRLGLPAFKVLGASWATYRLLERRVGGFDPWRSFAELRDQVAPIGALTLASATDGNHGRAVARIATMLGLSSRIRVPAGTVAARIDAIASEGAEVTVSDGGYDDAVAEVAAWADETTLVVSDTSWDGYVDVPAWIIEGYSTIFAEVAEQLADRGSLGPTVVTVPVGVGAFAAAAVTEYRRQDDDPTLLAAVEPVDAACVMASAFSGEVITLDGEQRSIMAGLNCGTPSPIAWPVVSQGIDVFVTVTDEQARAAMRAFAAVGVVSGESGAASYAGAVQLSAAGRLGASDRLLLLSTEGATDPVAYEQIVGHPPPALST